LEEDIPEVIRCFKFGVDRLRGLASAEGQILPFPIDFDGRPYNTLTLPCERVMLSRAKNLQNLIDDVITHSGGFENQLKTRFCYTEVEFLSDMFQWYSIRPLQTNVEKLTNTPATKTKKGDRSLLLAVGFLEKFITNCTEILKPSTDLTIRYDTLLKMA